MILLVSNLGSWPNMSIKQQETDRHDLGNSTTTISYIVNISNDRNVGHPVASMLLKMLKQL